MSYIRSTSNPEHLYIYGDGKAVHVCQKGDDFLIPPYTFNGLLKKWVDEYGNVSFRGASLIQIKDSEEFKWRLSYKRNLVDMWEVTLDRIASRFKDK